MKSITGIGGSSNGKKILFKKLSAGMVRGTRLPGKAKYNQTYRNCHGMDLFDWIFLRCNFSCPSLGEIMAYLSLKQIAEKLGVSDITLRVRINRHNLRKPNSKIEADKTIVDLARAKKLFKASRLTEIKKVYLEFETGRPVGRPKKINIDDK